MSYKLGFLFCIAFTLTPSVLGRRTPLSTPWTNSPSLMSFMNLVNSVHTGSTHPIPCFGSGASSSKTQGICVKGTSCSKTNGKELGPCSLVGWTCCVSNVIGQTSASKQPLTVVVTEPAVLLQQGGAENAQTLFEFPKQNEICGLKVNFLSTRIALPSSEVLQEGDCLVDSITLAGSPTLHSGFITVCGDMSGQIMHLSYKQGALADHPSDKISITAKTTSASTKYALNVIQVRCDDPELVASYCLQQYVADTGTVTSFAYPYQLNNQYYRFCTRALQRGARSVTWSECPISRRGLSSSAPFFVTESRSADGSLPPPEYGNFSPVSDYLFSSLLNPPGRHSGGSFPTVTVDNGLGHLSVNFDENEYGDAAIIRNMPKSVGSCSDIKYPFHTCRHPVIGKNKDTTCVCTLNYTPGRIAFTVPVLGTELCPTVKGYYCLKDSPIRCWCTQIYAEMDEANTGFCLQFRHNY